MINKFQKGCWILSSGAPIFIAFSIAWYFSKSTYMTSIVSAIAAAIFIIIAFVIFNAIKTKLPELQLTVKKIAQNDRHIIGYSLAYLLPFASIVFDKYNPYVFLGIAVIIFIIMLKANTPTANPLLFFVGYHFYDVEAENGIGNYLVISKRAIRNKDEIKNVIRITEYLLIDV